MHQLELCFVLGRWMVGYLGCRHPKQHPFGLDQNQQSLLWAGQYTVQPEQGFRRNLTGSSRWRRNRQGDKKDGNWLSNHDWRNAWRLANLCFQTHAKSVARHRSAFQLGQTKVAPLNDAWRGEEQRKKAVRGIQKHIGKPLFGSKNSNPYQILISV